MSKKEKLQPVSISILGKDYRIACSEDEHESLLQSAQMLDEKMREIRDSGTVNGTDRIAVMVALNLSHELHQAQNNNANPQNFISNQLSHLRHKIEHVLEAS